MSTTKWWHWLFAIGALLALVIGIIYGINSRRILWPPAVYAQPEIANMARADLLELGYPVATDNITCHYAGNREWLGVCGEYKWVFYENTQTTELLEGPESDVNQ